MTEKNSDREIKTKLKFFLSVSEVAASCTEDQAEEEIKA